MHERFFIFCTSIFIHFLGGMRFIYIMKGIFKNDVFLACFLYQKPQCFHNMWWFSSEARHTCRVFELLYNKHCVFQAKRHAVFCIKSHACRGRRPDVPWIISRAHLRLQSCAFFLSSRQIDTPIFTFRHGIKCLFCYIFCTFYVFANIKFHTEKTPKLA